MLRLELDVDLGCGSVTTLRVTDKALFARVVESLLSEKGEYAKEPYLLFDEDGKRVSPKRKMLVLHTLPEVPLNDRVLVDKLLNRIRNVSEADTTIYEKIQGLSAKLNCVVEETAGFLFGDYSFAKDWDLGTYLKAFSFLPQMGKCYTLLDNCIRLVELVTDVAPEMPLVMVNAKSFFTNEELWELFDRAVFSGVQLLLLETYNDKVSYEQERLIVVDRHFYVHQ